MNKTTWIIMTALLLALLAACSPQAQEVPPTVTYENVTVMEGTFTASQKTAMEAAVQEHGFTATFWGPTITEGEEAHLIVTIFTLSNNDISNDIIKTFCNKVGGGTHPRCRG